MAWPIKCESERCPNGTTPVIPHSVYLWLRRRDGGRSPHLLVKLPKPPRQTVALILTTGQSRVMPAIVWAQMAGRSRGGTTSHLRGVRPCWTTETARKAALKRWGPKGRNRLYKGRRVGLKSKRRAAIDHAALRVAYTVRYNPATSPLPLGRIFFVPHPLRLQWFEVTATGYRCLSERTALTKLGHLPSPRKHLTPAQVVGTRVVYEQPRARRK